MQQNKKFLVITIGRSGTHLVVRSISKEFKLPYATGIHYFQIEKMLEKSWVIGTHEIFNKEKYKKFKDNNVLMFGIERNILDNILSWAAWFQYSKSINSDSFINFLEGNNFKELFNSFLLWKENIPVFSYDVLADKNHKNHNNELKKFYDFIGKDIILEPIEVTMEKEKITIHGSSKGPGMWKKVYTQETIDKICNMLSIPTFVAEQNDKDIGDSIYLSTYKRVYTGSVDT